MTTTFSVISFGQFADIDPVEGINSAENAGLLVGITIGRNGDPLVNDIVTLSVVGDTKGYYGSDGKPVEQFRINDGYPQRYDSIAAYNSTITFADGTTGTVTVVVAQDTDGNLYLVPSAGSSADLSIFNLLRSFRLRLTVSKAIPRMACQRTKRLRTTCRAF